MARRSLVTGVSLSLGAAAVAARLVPLARSARMTGSSIAAPGASLWVTDFLNAAYFARTVEERSLDDLRLARAILATRWYRTGRRLGARDLVVFDHAFRRVRFSGAGRRGRLSFDELLEGGARLLGGWFAAAATDPSLRGWGIVFASQEERARYRPEARLERGPLLDRSPLVGREAARRWHTYPPVPVRSIEATTAAISDPARWPDFGSALGQFTAVRSGGLDGQTFEIEIVVLLTRRTPALVRAYVTAERVFCADEELRVWCGHLNEGLAAWQEEPALPDGARPVLGLDLVTHEGHFMGAALSRILLFEQDGHGYLRDTGVWDPMPWHLGLAYRRGGAAAQQSFWGAGLPEDSMLHAFAAA